MPNLLLALLCLVGSSQVGAEPGGAEIGRAIRDLGNESYAAREQAMRFLWSNGVKAQAALTKALESPDLEVAARAGIILERIKFGVLPGTPSEIESLIFQFHYGDAGTKYRIIGELLKKGESAHSTLVTLVSNVRDERLRQSIGSQLASQAAATVATLLAEGKVTDAERLLEVCAVSGNVACARHFAAYWLADGDIEEQVARYKDRTDWTGAILLACLHRAAGDLVKARTVAEASRNAEIKRGILYELGDWKALATVYSEQARPRNMREDPLFGAAFYWFGGETEKHGQAIKQLIEKCGQQAQSYLIWDTAETLLLTGQPEQAIRLLVDHRQYEKAFELRCTQLRYKEAFQLYEKALQDKNPNLVRLRLSAAGRLAALGETERAREAFSSVFEEQKQAGNFSWAPHLIEEELKSGLRDDALEHCAEALSRAQPGYATRNLLEKVFPDRGQDAEVWWAFLQRRLPEEDAAAALKRLRQVMRGKLAETELASLANGLAKEAGELDQKQKAQWLVALGRVLRNHRKPDLAEKHLREAGKHDATGAAYRDLGDLLARAKRWGEAAESYRMASERMRNDARNVFLRGWALSQSGAKAEGAKLMTLANRMLLGNEVARHALAEAQQKLGLFDYALRQRELILRTGNFQSWHVGDAMRKIVPRLVEKKDYGRAALHWERAMLDCLKASVNFQDASAYLVVPQYVYMNRARQFLNEGKIEGVRRVVGLCQKALPGGTDLPVYLVRELEAAGYQEDSDKVFGTAFEALKKVLDDYPNAAVHHNQMAWMLAKCGRELDVAMEHVGKALKPQPDSAAYLDTLAEIHFQRGNRAEAIKTIKRCIELSPSNKYYQRQLKRFETEGPPD